MWLLGECKFGAGGAFRNKAWWQQVGEEEAGRAKSQSVSAVCSESEETASLKGPGSANLIRQEWKKFSR